MSNVGVVGSLWESSRALESTHEDRSRWLLGQSKLTVWDSAAAEMLHLQSVNCDVRTHATLHHPWQKAAAIQQTKAVDIINFGICWM